MERMCSVLKLSTNGTIDFMRTQIIEYAERNNAEEKIFELAYQHKQIVTKKTRATSNQTCTSSPALLTHRHSPSVNSPVLPISPSLFSNYDEETTQNEQGQIHSDIDELMEMGNDLTLRLNERENEREKNDHSPENPETYPCTDNARNKCPLVSTVPINDSMWDDGELNLGNVHERKMGFLFDESTKIITAKDKQIKELEENLKVASDMNAKMCE